MTQDEKRAELRSWETAKLQREKHPPTGFVGGHGYPDPEIYAYVDRLNRLTHLATLQSCAGHVCLPSAFCSWCAENTDVSIYGVTQDQVWRDSPSDKHVMNGQLWLWPDEKLGQWFLYHAPELANIQPVIDKVAVLWHVAGREIIDIQFRGAGHGTLADSMQIICAFFERGNMEVNLG